MTDLTNETAFLDTPTDPIRTTVFVTRYSEAGWNERWEEATERDANEGRAAYEIERNLWDAYQGAQAVFDHLDTAISKMVEPQVRFWVKDYFKAGLLPQSILYIYGRGIDPLCGKRLRVVGWDDRTGSFICLPDRSGPGEEVSVHMSRAQWTLR